LTIDEFQKKYHDYMVQSEQEAATECAKVNKELVDGEAVAVDFEFCWGLMLKTAHEGLDELAGIKLPTSNSNSINPKE
jgi:hypothetical protein